ncbi:hypothetical protein Shyd_25740 [Streptomyces hydrogenans]|uniref:Uncharacterized protein n=1 Tax=Streptomyces hydrogenans TaxID=1873719 RepID=A0ABQ3P857_9ACTN|nr:hypothetical protein GCM10018784_64650 [Streptomyces hydrogenans]GHI21203.1 hypothetical protein Shyd_25740 [Streptomyces hydrogenans]
MPGYGGEGPEREGIGHGPERRVAGREESEGRGSGAEPGPWCVAGGERGGG